MFSQTTFSLLRNLDRNNDKAWFDAHRDEIRVHVQEPFEATLDAVEDRLAGSALPLKGGKQTLFRMNRDIRFSNDKRPYNAHVSGVLTASGAKDDPNGLV